MEKNISRKIMLTTVIIMLIFSTSIPATAANKNRLIIVGDSRTYNMCQWVSATNQTVFIAKNGQGYLWFEEEAVNKVTKLVKAGDSIVIWLGVNDYFQNMKGQDSWKVYAEKINNLSENEWSGCKIYVASVGYVDRNRMLDYYGKVTRTNITRLDRNRKMKGIKEFNESLCKNLSKNITWLDTYEVIGIDHSDSNYIPEDIWATRTNGQKDGLHYGQAKTKQVYDFFIESTIGKAN